MINATGVWTDETQALVGERGQFQVRASKGIHLVVPRDRIRGDSGLILRTEKSVLFVIPWGRHWIIGTTDTDWELDKAHPAASAADIDYLLEHVNAVLEQPLTHDDVEGVYAGLRPLLSGESESTSKLSREHAVAHTGARAGRGGRRQVHDLPGDGQGRRRRRGARAGRQGRRRRSPTQVPLLGAEGYTALKNRPHVLAQPLRAARGAHRAPARPLRLAGPRGAGPGRRRPDAGRAARRGAGLPARRDRLRGLARGRPAPRRRADPAHPDLDRDLRPRASARSRRPPGWWLRCWAGARSRSSARSSTTASGSRPSGRASACPTTRPPTPPGWAPRRSSRLR